MNFIENIIEPNRLYLAWKPYSESRGRSLIVGEIERNEESKGILRYLAGTQDFAEAIKARFDGYGLFSDFDQIITNAAGLFYRRIMSRRREDFIPYLECHRLKPDVQISNFALLGYTGGRLMSDDFSFVHPFDNVSGPCEMQIKAEGFNQHAESIGSKMAVGDELNLEFESDDILIKWGNNLVGYVSRGLRESIVDWLANNRIDGVYVEKIQTLLRPVLYIFVRVKK